MDIVFQRSRDAALPPPGREGTYALALSPTQDGQRGVPPSATGLRPTLTGISCQAQSAQLNLFIPFLSPSARHRYLFLRRGGMKNKKIKYKCWVFWGKPTLENLCCISSINKYIDLMCIHLNESRWAWLVLFVKVFHHLMNNLFGHPFQSFQAVGARFHLPLFFFPSFWLFYILFLFSSPLLLRLHNNDRAAAPRGFSSWWAEEGTQALFRFSACKNKKKRT